MIKKVAEAQALRGAYQGIFEGTYDESEAYDAKTINTTAKTELDVAKEKIIEVIDKYPEPDKSNWKEKCVTAVKENKFDLPFAKEVATQLNIEL